MTLRRSKERILLDIMTCVFKNNNNPRKNKILQQANLNSINYECLFIPLVNKGYIRQLKNSSFEITDQGIKLFHHLRLIQREIKLLESKFGV